MYTNDLLNDIDYMSVNISRAFEDINTLDSINYIRNTNKPNDVSDKLTKIAVESIANTLGVNLNVSLEDYTSTGKAVIDFISRILKNILDAIKWIGNKLIEVLLEYFSNHSTPVSTVDTDSKEAVKVNDAAKKRNGKRSKDEKIIDNKDAIDELIAMALSVSNIGTTINETEIEELFLYITSLEHITPQQVKDAIPSCKFENNNNESANLNENATQIIFTLGIKNPSYLLRRSFFSLKEITPYDINKRIMLLIETMTFLTVEYDEYLDSIINIFEHHISNIDEVKTIEDLFFNFETLLTSINNQTLDIINNIPHSIINMSAKDITQDPVITVESLCQFYTKEIIQDKIMLLLRLDTYNTKNNENVPPTFAGFKREDFLTINENNIKLNNLFKDDSIVKKYRIANKKAIELIKNMRIAMDEKSSLSASSESLSKLADIVKKTLDAINILSVINSGNIVKTHAEISNFKSNVNTFIKHNFTKPITAIIKNEK